MAIWQTFYSNKNDFNKPGADLGILRGGGGGGRVQVRRNVHILTSKKNTSEGGLNPLTPPPPDPPLQSQGQGRVAGFPARSRPIGLPIRFEQPIRKFENSELPTNHSPLSFKAAAHYMHAFCRKSAIWGIGDSRVVIRIPHYIWGDRVYVLFCTVSLPPSCVRAKG